MAFRITRHAKERYLERKKYAHLKGIKQWAAISTDLSNKKTRDLIDDEIMSCLYEATEERWFINNSNIMEEFYGKYGFKDFKFLVHDEIVYVITVSEGTDIVVTCMAAKRHKITRNVVKKTKFKKKQYTDVPGLVRKVRNKMTMHSKG